MSAKIAIPDELRRLMAEVGPNWATNVLGHVKLMVEAFSVVLARCPKDGVSVRRNLAYGTHARQVLDVYSPANPQGSPVVVFAHGGSFHRRRERPLAEIRSEVVGTRPPNLAKKVSPNGLRTSGASA